MPSGAVARHSVRGLGGAKRMLRPLALDERHPNARPARSEAPPSPRPDVAVAIPPDPKPRGHDRVNPLNPAR